MYNQLEKAINLAKKTGDRLIIFDNVRSENAFVVMSLDEYEKVSMNRSEVRGLTEDQLLDKINRDIAVWKSDQDQGFFNVNQKETPIEDFQKNHVVESNEEHDDYVGFETRRKERKQWSIPTEVKQGAEEIIEEDRQYLEEVSF